VANPAPRCQICSGSGLNKTGIACFCTRACETCDTLDRGPLGHCRKCNNDSTQRHLKRIMNEKLTCPTCGVFDRSPSGACRPCFKRRNERRIFDAAICHVCNTTDWNASGGCRRCLKDRKIKLWPLHLVANAKRRNLTLNTSTCVNVEWVWEKFSEQHERCFYTNARLVPANCGSRAPNQPSLDRIDNSVGYTVDNTRLTSLGWNFLRNTASIEDTQAFLLELKDVK
jgi:hypothetical protein